MSTIVVLTPVEYFVLQCRALHRRLDLSQKERDQVQSEVSESSQTIAQLKVR